MNEYITQKLTEKGEPETRWSKWGMVYLSLLVVADRAITLPHWGLESNPIVNAVGPIPWLLLTASVILLANYLWYAGGVRQYRVARIATGIVSGLYLLVVVTNGYIAYLL